MKLSALPLIVLFALSSCAGHPRHHGQDEHPAAAPQASEPAEDPAADAEKAKAKATEQLKKVEELEHKLRVAETKMELAMMDVKDREIALGEKREGAQQAFKVAESNLANFEQMGRPTQVGRAQMSLKGAQDSAKEAEEELQQLALMYSDQNLEEMTSEFVIGRGKRRAERAAKRIEFAAMDLRSLTTHKLRLEQEKLAIAVKKAGQALKALDREEGKNKLGNGPKMLEAGRALTKAKEALEEARAEGEQA